MRQEMDRLMDTLFSYRLSSGVMAAAELGLLEALAGSPMHSSELADRLRLNHGRLCVFLQWLVAVGVLARIDDGRFVCEGRPVQEVVALERLLMRGPNSVSGIVSALSCGRGADEVRETAEYRDVMYGRAVTLALTRGVIRAIDRSDLAHVIEVGNSPGAIAATLVRLGQARSGSAWVLPQHYPAAQAEASDQGRFCAGAGEPALLPLSSEADLVIVYNTVHMLDERSEHLVWRRIGDVTGDTGLLVVIDLFADCSPLVARHLVIDWITHGGLNNIDWAALWNKLAGAGWGRATLTGCGLNTIAVVQRAG